MKWVKKIFGRILYLTRKGHSKKYIKIPKNTDILDVCANGLLLHEKDDYYIDKKRGTIILNWCPLKGTEIIINYCIKILN